MSTDLHIGVWPGSSDVAAVAAGLIARLGPRIVSSSAYVNRHAPPWLPGGSRVNVELDPRLPSEVDVLLSPIDKSGDEVVLHFNYRTASTAIFEQCQLSVIGKNYLDGHPRAQFGPIRLTIPWRSVSRSDRQARTKRRSVDTLALQHVGDMRTFLMVLAGCFDRAESSGTVTTTQTRPTTVVASTAGTWTAPSDALLVWHSVSSEFMNDLKRSYRNIRYGVWGEPLMTLAPIPDDAMPIHNNLVDRFPGDTTSRRNFDTDLQNILGCSLDTLDTGRVATVLQQESQAIDAHGTYEFLDTSPDGVLLSVTSLSPSSCLLDAYLTLAHAVS